VNEARTNEPGRNVAGMLTTTVTRDFTVSLTQVKVMTLDVSTSDISSIDHDIWRMANLVVGWQRTKHDSLLLATTSKKHSK